MENAAKALLIAGGILIAIIILSMFLVMYNKMASLQKTQEEKTKMEQIAAFNAEYEAYNKKLMYGADVITLYNKVSQNNNDNPHQIINIKVTVPDSFGGNINDFSSLSEQEKEDFLKFRFKCTKMSTNNSGVINEIEIIPAQ